MLSYLHDVCWIAARYRLAAISLQARSKHGLGALGKAERTTIGDDVFANLRLVETWAASQVSPRTRTAYRYEGRRLFTRLGKSLANAVVSDLQSYVASLGDDRAGGSTVSSRGGRRAPGRRGSGQ